MNTKTMLGLEMSQECMYFYFFINGNEIKEFYKISLVQIFIRYCVGYKGVSKATMNYNLQCPTIFCTFSYYKDS